MTLQIERMRLRVGFVLHQVEPEVQKLYDYIYERGTIIPVEDYSSELLSVGDVSKRVTESIRTGTKEWESLVSYFSNFFLKVKMRWPYASLISEWATCQCASQRVFG